MQQVLGYRTVGAEDASSAEELEPSSFKDETDDIEDGDATYRDEDSD